MGIELVKATIQQKVVVKHLLELYKYDFSEFDNEDVDEQGVYGYTYLDNYWTEPDERFPFLVKVDGKYAGFALIRKIKKGSEFYYSMAEFFILKKYRKKGIGKQVAFQLFNLFPGIWEVAEIEENISAQKFWRKVISEYTNNDFNEFEKDDWQVHIQTFHILTNISIPELLIVGNHLKCIV